MCSLMRQHPITPASAGNPIPPSDIPPSSSLFSGVSGLSPAYFGMVMATGIVSLVAHMLAMRGIAQALFRFNLLAYGVLWLLTVARLVCYPRRFFDDLTDHLRGPGFFTTVAASSILGSQFVILADSLRMGIALWCVATALWGVLTYAIFMAFTVKEHKPSLEQGISGGWLLAVVATQSIAVLSALLAARAGAPYRLALNFFALSMLLWGGMLYIWMMALIFYRYTFLRFSPGDLLPPYWINMGAMAISTLAGSLLTLNAANAPFLQSLLPFLKGFTVFYWAAGTWWIPMLLLLGVWRHLYRRYPLRYDPLYWSIVFPLGMYAAATHAMEEALGLDLLGFLPPVFLYAALGAWGAALAGMIYEVTRRIARRPG